MTDSTREDRDQGSDDEFGLNAVRELLQLLSTTDITEIQIERGATKLHIKRGAALAPSFMVTPSLVPAMQGASHGALPSAAQAMAHYVAGGPATAPTPEAEAQSTGNVIVSPMVGTYYASPSPKDAPFAQEGDLIQAGDVVGIVEAMKIMNEIDSEFSGRITRILVTNGQPVEYGQALMVVEPV